MANVETQSPVTTGTSTAALTSLTLDDHSSPYPPPNPSGIRPAVGQVWPRGNTRGNT